MDKIIAAQYDRRKIYRQEPVATYYMYRRISKKDRRHDEHGIYTFGFEFYFINDKDNPFTNCVAGNGTNHHLFDELENKHRDRSIAVCKQVGEANCKNVSHWVITAAFQLEQMTETALEGNIPCAKNGK